MDQTEILSTIQNLDKAFPDGWRCGNELTDMMTIMLCHSLSIVTMHMFFPGLSKQQGR